MASYIIDDDAGVRFYLANGYRSYFIHWLAAQKHFLARAKLFALLFLHAGYSDAGCRTALATDVRVFPLTSMRHHHFLYFQASGDDLYNAGFARSNVQPPRRRRPYEEGLQEAATVPKSLQYSY